MRFTSFLYLLAPALFSSLWAKAQSEERTFKSFRIDVAMSYIKPDKLENRYAFGFSMEPKYGITDAVWVGLRLESGILIQNTPQYKDDYQALGIFSVLPTVDYSFVVNERFRPFAGFGVGRYYYQTFYDGEDSDSQKGVTQTGFCPRVGFDYKTFRLAVEYNSVPNGGSYTAIKMGWSIGGGLVD